MTRTPSQAVILGSNRGFRRLNATKSVPISLRSVESSGTVLDWALHSLAEHGIDQVTYIGGYQIQKVIERYLLCRIGGMNYCGAAFYGYSMVEGLQSLLLSVVTLGWLMRVAAVKAGRKKLVVEDAYQAVMTIDGNMGYSQALGMSAARLRLEYLSGHLGTLLRWYCL